MKTILGKLTIIYCIVWGTIYTKMDSIVVKMLDTQHQEIKEAAIGQPFTIEVILKGNIVSQGQPVFENLDRINGRRSGYQMNSINGNATVIYTYQARVDKEGTYIVGPIYVGKSSVDSFEIVVGQKKQLLSSKKSKKQKVQLHFFVDTSDVVIGEKISCRLRFFHTDEKVIIKNIGQPEIPGFEQTEIEGPFVGTEVIGGTHFYYKEWQWSLAAFQDGQYLIPAYYADYSEPKKQHGLWSGFAHLFDNHDIKRVYSNAEKIVVHAFDDALYPVCAVGKNVTIVASVDNSIVNQSEGITLRIDVTGDESSSLRPIKSLINIPQELKWYQSQSTSINNNTLRSEFIIQGLKSGDYEIPSQLFTYFDRDTREYKNIATDPLLISIVPLCDTKDENFSQKNEQLLCTDNIKNQDNTLVLNQLPLSNGYWYVRQHTRPFSWILFIIITIILGLAFCYDLIIELIRKCFYSQTQKSNYKKAFSHALNAIRHAQRCNDTKQLYAIFMQLLTIRLRIVNEEQSSMVINNVLSSRFVDTILKDAWVLFFNELERVTYGHDTFHNDQLFKQAIEWINVLKKIM